MVGLSILAASCAVAPDAQTNFLLPDLYKGLHDSSGNGLCINSLDAVRVLLINAVQITLAIAGLVAVAMIIYAGFVYITSNGNASAITKAKDTLINWVIGLIVVIGAYAIVGLIAGALH